MFKIISILLVICFFGACDTGKKVSNLESQINQLKEDLKKASDPKTVAKLQMELLKTTREEFDRLEKERAQTTDKASCEKINAQIKEKEKNSVFNSVGMYDGKCTDSGWDDKKRYDGK